MKKGIRAPMLLLCLAALSSTAIMCSTAGSYEPAASSVELRQVQRINTALTGMINTAIARQAQGGVLMEWDICPPNMDIRRMLDHRFTRWTERDTRPDKLTVRQLQELRTLINLKADEAFQTGKAGDFAGGKLDRGGFTGTITVPQTQVQFQ